ncbi:hypothetical protein C8R45DRAFT_185855 [Mycena sanguinolenta]|nr:hypothetical protein C8R45DRAFT_185855 [Mycena sanguinolenta]
MESPFTPFLNTNFVPTDAQCDEIHAFLRGPRTELADVTEKIARLQTLIDDAARERDELEGLIDAHLALVSPVRRLPDDIMQEIFLAARPAGRNPAIISDEAPLLLCQICKSWRTIALTTPSLWASLHIVVPSLPDLPQLMEKVTAWLGRSGTVPLDISLIYSRTSDTRDDISPLISILLAVCRRWRTMELALTGLPDFASLTADDVPVLQRIFFYDTIDRASADPSPLSFLGTQSLRSLRCGSIHHILNNPISWGTLAELAVSSFALSFQDAFQILGQCPLLETCKLAIHSRKPVDTAWSTSSTQTVSLPKLRHFTLKHRHIVPIPSTHFFDHLLLPALRSFHCLIPDGVLPSDTRSLFPRGTSDLEYLKVDIRRMNSSLLLAGLSEMSSLQELHIAQEPCEDGGVGRRDAQFLMHLTLSDTSVPVICPRLRRLKLERFRDVSDDILLEFILLRMRQRLTTETSLSKAVPLERFTCELHRPMERDIRAELQSRAVDVEINLTYQAAQWLGYSPLEGFPEDPVNLWRTF